MGRLDTIKRWGRMADSAMRPVHEPFAELSLSILDRVGQFTFYTLETIIHFAGVLLRLPTKKQFWWALLGAVLWQLAGMANQGYKKELIRYQEITHRHATFAVRLPNLENSSATYSEEELYCIARVVYGESKGESQYGKHLVAMVVINRALRSGYPSDICTVVNADHQFDGYTASMNLAYKTDFDSFIESYNIARSALETYVYSPNVEKNILYFHADYVKPAWGRTMERAFVEGKHIFYRESVGGID